MTSTYLRSIPGLRAELSVQDGHQVLGPMAYVSDMGWELVLHNDAFAQLFLGGDPPANIMKWVTFDGQDQLPDLDSVWRRRALPQLRGQLDRHPADARLLALRDWCESTPGVAEAWSAVTRGTTDAPDGDVRPLIHPTYGLGSVEIGVLAPHRPGCRDELRICMLDFHIGVTPEQVLARRGPGWQPA